MRKITNKKELSRTCDFLGTGRWVSMDQIKSRLQVAEISKGIVLVNFKTIGDCEGISRYEYSKKGNDYFSFDTTIS